MINRYTTDELRIAANNCESNGMLWYAKALRQAADDAERLAVAQADTERMDELELSQRADVYWQENGEQELAGYEWGCGGQYSTARDALDAAIAARNQAKE